jgi:Tfp pilus assembly protein PilX
MKRPATHQRGVALIASMLILIIITLLGLSTMRSAGLQERMSGNQYDRNVVLEAAEAALRQGEAIAAAPLTIPATCTNGVCPKPVAGMADRWTDSGFTGWQAATSTRPALVTASSSSRTWAPSRWTAPATCRFRSSPPVSSRYTASRPRPGRPIAAAPS